MLKLTRTGIGLLTRQYRSVLHKCWLINVGLWQAMGDAVSKAVSVPTRLVASLLSGGTMSGEAFNMLDEILLSRLFERKLASLTAIGLTIAAVTMPSTAEAATPTEVLNLLNTGNETWTISGSSEQGTSFNPSTKTATGTVGIKVNDTITYYTYTYTTPYTSSDAIENLSGNVVNKYFYNYSYAASNYSDQNYSVTADFIKNAHVGLYNYAGSMASISGNFIGNITSVEGSAIHVANQGTIDNVTGDFIANITQGENSADGALLLDGNSRINTVNANFIANVANRSAGAIDNEGGSSIGGLLGNFIGNAAIYSPSQYAGNSFGGAINNGGTIGNIGSSTKSVNFYSNYVSSIYETRGGAIQNTGTITNIGTSANKAIFSGNYVESSGRDSQGGAIYNSGKIYNIDAEFNDNAVTITGTNYYGKGGAIAQNSNASIANVAGSFTGNYVTGANAEGGAVHMIYSSIENINADFKNNYTAGVYTSAGGAIFTWRGSSINSLTGNFINNYALSDLSSAVGGAIALIEGINYSNIINISNSTFTNNYVIGNSDSRGGAILNAGTIGFSGTNTFTNNKANGALNDIYNENTINITGGTTTLNSGYNGTTGAALNISSSATFDLNENNNQLHTSNLGVLTNDGTFQLGIDIQHPTSGTTGTADLFNISSGSSGSILIDAINEIGTRPTATGTYLYQVLNGSGVTLALTDAIKTEWNTDTTTSSPKVRDPIPATTVWTDKIYNRWIDTRVQGSLDVSGNNLVYSVINTQTAQSEVAGDTLALVTTATNNASRIFSTTDATAEYLLSTNLGAVNAVYKNLSINGTVSGNNRSTLNLGNYNGFVLDSSDDNLSLSSMKVSGGNEYSVNLADSGSKLDVADVIMDNTAAPIVGSGNVEFTGTNEINARVLNTGTTTVSSGTTDFNDEVAGFTVAAPATVSIAADDITAETTNNGTLELEGGNVTTKLMGIGRMKLMSGNVRLLSSTPPATTGSLSFGSSSDYADSILTSSSADSTSDHALVTAGYLDNNYYMNYGDSMAKSFIKAANDNNFTTLNCVKEA